MSIEIKEINLKEEKIFSKEDKHMKLLNKCIRTIRKDCANEKSELFRIMFNSGMSDIEMLAFEAIKLLYKSKLKEIENE